MKKILIILALFILGCNENELSEIEVIKFDSNKTDMLNTESDSVFHDTKSQYQGAKATHYFQIDKSIP